MRPMWHWLIGRRWKALPRHAQNHDEVVVAAGLAASHSPRRALLHRTDREFPPPWSKDRHLRAALHFPEAAGLLLSIRGAPRYPQGRIPYPAHARSIPRSCTDLSGNNAED